MLSSAARAMCPAVVPRVSADDGAARERIPVRRAEPGERRARSRHRRCRARESASASTSAACANQSKAVAQPLHHGAADEHAPFEGVLGASVDLPGHRGHQPVSRRRRRRADVLQQEAAGAVGVLRHPRRAAHLAEERRLLVAGDPRDRHLPDAERGGRLAVDAARRAHLRQHRRRHAEQRQQLVVPLQRVDVEQHRPRRVAHVGHVLASARSASRSATCRRCRTPAARPRRGRGRRRRGRGSIGSCWLRSTHR